MDYINDRFKALQAVKENGRALKSVSKELQSDREVVMAAVMNYDNAFSSPFQYASRSLKNDKEFVLAVVKEDPQALQFAFKRLRDDKDVVLAAIKRYDSAIIFASPRLLDDVDVVREAVKQNPKRIMFASKRIRNNPSLLDKKPSLDEIIASAQSRANQNKGVGKEAPKKEKIL